MLFGLEGELDQALKVSLGQRRPVLSGGRDFLPDGPALTVGDDHPVLCTNHRLFHFVLISIEDIGIRCNLATDDRLSQPVARIGNHLATFTSGRVGGKQNTGNIRFDHDLYHHSHGHLIMIDAHLLAIADRTRGPQGYPTISHCCEQGVFANDVEVGILLTGE